MSLVELCDNELTDKNTVHSYLDLYEQLISKKKFTASHILEVGIGPIHHKNGGSIKLWADYFPNAIVHALDIIPINSVLPSLINHPRVYLHCNTDAYNATYFANYFASKKERFDLVLDDGPHSLESMRSFISLYSTILKDDGILIIEDVQDISWIDELTKQTPEQLKSFIEVYDRRKVKGRYDDIVFVINKSRNV